MSGAGSPPPFADGRGRGGAPPLEGSLAVVETPLKAPALSLCFWNSPPSPRMSCARSTILDRERKRGEGDGEENAVKKETAAIGVFVF